MFASENYAFYLHWSLEQKRLLEPSSDLNILKKYPSCNKASRLICIRRSSLNSIVAWSAFPSSVWMFWKASACSCDWQLDKLWGQISNCNVDSISLRSMREGEYIYRNSLSILFRTGHCSCIFLKTSSYKFEQKQKFSFAVRLLSQHFVLLHLWLIFETKQDVGLRKARIRCETCGNFFWRYIMTMQSALP